MATVADDGTLTLRLRMPDCLAVQHGNYLTIEGVRFAYGHEQQLAALDSNAEYGEKAARATSLGQAISYRLKHDEKGWWVFATTDMMDVPVVTDKRRGTIGVDLNADHLAVAEADASGNYVNAFSVPLVTYGKIKARFLSRGQREGVEIHQVNPAFSSVIGRVKFTERYGLSVYQAADMVLARRLLGCSELIPRRWVAPVGNGVHVAFTAPVRKRVKHVWTYWGAISG